MSSEAIRCPCNTSKPPGSNRVSATSSHQRYMSVRDSLLRILRGSHTSSQIIRSKRPPRKPESIPNADHDGSFCDRATSPGCTIVNASARQISLASGLNCPKSCCSVRSASTANPNLMSFISARATCSRSNSARKRRVYHSANRCVEEPSIPLIPLLRTVAHAGSTLAKNVDLPLPGGAFMTTYSSKGVSKSEKIFSVASICHG